MPYFLTICMWDLRIMSPSLLLINNFLYHSLDTERFKLDQVCTVQKDCPLGAYFWRVYFMIILNLCLHSHCKSEISVPRCLICTCKWTYLWKKMPLRMHLMQKYIWNNNLSYHEVSILMSMCSKKCNILMRYKGVLLKKKRERRTGRCDG